MTLDIQLNDANFSGLSNPEVFSADPMLAAPIGVIGLFDSQSIASWPSQSNPNTVNQKIYNRVPNATVPYLQVGNGTGLDGQDPTWNNSEQAFVFTKNPPSIIQAIDNAHFRFTNTAFLITYWFKTTSLFNRSDVQVLIGRRDGTTVGSPITLGLDDTYLYADVYNGTNTITARSNFSPLGNTQIGMSWQPVTSTISIYANGKFLNSTTVNGTSTLPAGGNFRIGDDVFSKDDYFKRLYIEDLTVSGNDPAARVALEYSKIIEILT